MRRRSGGLHCSTEEEFLEQANDTESEISHGDVVKFREVKFEDQQWNLGKAQKQNSNHQQIIQFPSEESEVIQQQKQLSKGKKYLSNCFVDKQIIRCSIQICIVTQKIQDVLNKISGKDSFLTLFTHSKESRKYFINQHLTTDSNLHSNIFCLKTHDCYDEVQKQNFRPFSKNSVKENSKNERMMELIIVKKHIGIHQNNMIEQKKISIIHRIFIVNRKYIQNPLIKIYLQKSHFVIQLQDSLATSLKFTINKKIYEKIFNHKSLLQKQCLIFNKGQYLIPGITQTKTIKFKNIFHKIEDIIAKNDLKRLNQLLVQQKTTNFIS